jgi:hypothetical protein
MAKRHEGLYPPGTTAKGVAGLFNPGDPLKDAAYAAATGKSLADTQKIQADNAAAANFRALIARGNATPQELVAAAAYNPSLLAEIPKVHLLQVASNPNASPDDRAVAAQAAGIAYGSTEKGTNYVQGQENVRAGIAAGPGYAAANAQRYGHDLSYRAAHDRLVQEHDQWVHTPEPQYDAGTNTTTYLNRGDLVGRGPTPSIPFSPQAYEAANKSASFSLTPGGTPILGRQSDLTDALMHPEQRTFYAPTPGDVQTQEREPIEATTPGDTTPRWVTKGDIRRNPGMYSPVPKAGTAGPAAPQPSTLPANSDYLAEQALRGQFNLAAGLTGQGFQKGDLGAAGPATLPKEIEQRLPEFRTQVQRYAQLNNLNFDDAAWQVMRETYGTPTADASGKQGFNIQLPTFRSLWMASPTVTAGTPAPPRPVATSPEGHPQITPQPATTTTAQPAGAPRPPPNNPTAVLAPPPPAPGYQPGGAQPYVPPTISLGGNPAPAPTPRLLVQSAPPPAPAPAPQTATAPAPNPDTATLLQHAQDAIAAGANAAAVAARLKSQFNIDLPPPPAPAPQASAP